MGGNFFRCVVIFLLVCFGTVIFEINADLSCQTGWNLFYRDKKCIKLFLNRSPWAAARKACQAKGGDLVVIRDQTKNNFVRDLIIDHGRQTDVWIGLYRAGQNFQWLDDPETIQFTFWAPGQPDNYHQNENCGEFTGSTHKWNDLGCTYSGDYVCETNALTKSPIICPIGWTKHKETCFQLFKEKKNWAIANNFCLSENGNLAKIENQETTTFLNENVFSKKRGEFWIGLNDLTLQNKYVWLNSTQRAVYTNWIPGKPSTHDHCVDVKTSQGNQWDADNCFKEKEFLCQRPPMTIPHFCPAGWTRHVDTCFKLFPDKFNWKDANQVCVSVKGHLAKIEYLDTAIFLKKTIFQNQTDEIWIGLNDLKHSGKFVWLNNTYGATYTNWDSTDQSSGVTGGQTCVDVKTAKGNTWGKDSCNIQKKFLCQRLVNNVLLECPVGYTLMKEMLSCIKLSSDTKEWEKARSTCQRDGGDLLQILDRDINQFVIDLISKQKAEYWIGLHDRHEENKFQWLDSTRNLSFKFFATNEPDDTEGNQNCVEIDGNKDSHWYDDGCIVRKNYICQLPPIVNRKPQNVTKTILICPDGWTKYGPGNTCVKYNKNKKSWVDARNTCQKEGGDLIRIADGKMDKFVNNFLTQQGAKLNIYIGLNDRVMQWHYVWLDEKHTPNYTNWYKTEPSGGNSECVVIIPTTNYNFEWDDVDCSEAHGYMCQQDALPVGSVNCGYGWEDGSDSNYCYRFNSDPLTWYEAKDSCTINGGDLVSIVNVQEMLYLSVRLKGLNDGIWWTGGNSMGGGWEWSDKKPFAFLNWNFDQPNQNASKDCIAVHKDTGRWSDESCQLHKPSICKKKSKTINLVTLPPTVPPTGLPNDKVWGCPMGWHGYRGSCYIIKSSQTNVPWNSANSACRKIHSELVAIADPDENAFVSSLYALTNISGPFWIGLNDRNKMFSFTWSDRFAPVTFTTWDRGEPSNLGSIATCILMRNNGKWINRDCTDVHQYFSCKRSKEILNKSQVDQSGCRKDSFGFYDKCYSIIDIPQTFDNARQQCSSAGGNLAKIPNHFVQAFLVSQIPEFAVESIWIGLSNRKQATTGDPSLQNAYLWTSGERMHFSFWDSSHTGKENNSCVAMKASQAGLWHSYPCTQSMSFLCEFPRPGYTTPKPVTTVETLLSCPTNWIAIGHMCYKPVFDTRKTWMDARAACEGIVQGGTLASVTNSGLTSRLRMEIKKTKYSFTAWIGLNDRDVEGGYKWLDGQPFSYNNWAYNEPDKKDTSKDCTNWNVLYNSWHLSSCYVANNFLCQAPRAKQCGSGSWSMYGGYCYFVNQQAWGGKSWFDARDECRSMGADLASIANDDENNYLITLLSKNQKSSFWIGLTDLDGDVYKWADGTPMHVLHWNDGEPNDHDDGERCVQFLTNGRWNDNNCNRAYPYVCKKKLGSSSPITLPVTTPPKGGCPDSFHGVPGTSHCYHVGGMKVADRKSFGDAEKACKAIFLKSRLASLHSALDEDFIMTMISPVKIPAWIGFKSTGLYIDNYLWVDNTRRKYDHWAPQQPHHYNHQNKGCVEVMIKPRNAGDWKNVDCSQKLAYICEFRKDTTFPVEKPKTEGCPSGYQKYRSSCYKYVSTPKTWSLSESQCLDDKGHLVALQDRFETAFLEILISSKNLTGLWIGLADLAQKNAFSWSSGWPIFYTDWANNQPDLSHQCALHKPNVGWATSNCTAALPFVCEIENDPVPVPTPSVLGKCADSSWTQYGEYCYYVETQRFKTWPGADFACKLIGGHLVSIHSASEAQGVAMLIGIDRVDAWIGLEGTDSGSFKWSDQSEEEIWRWAPGSPIHSKDTQHHSCVLAQGFDGNWTNVDCFTNHGYVCKVKQIPLPKTNTSTSTISTTSSTTSTTSRANTSPIKASTKKLPTTQRTTQHVPRTSQPPSHPTPSSTGHRVSTQSAVINVPPSTQTISSQKSKSKSSGLSSGPIAGIVVAILAVIFVAVVVIVVVVRRRRLPRDPPSSSPSAGFENVIYTGNDTQVKNIAFELESKECPA